MKYLYLTLILSVVVFAGNAYSYIISPSSLDSGNVNASSASFSHQGGIAERQMNTPTSESFSIRTGFLGSSFSAPLGPIVTAVDPTWAYNITTVVPITVTGANFSTSSLIVRLKRSGETNITATGYSIKGSREVFCIADVMGKAAGKWDVEVENPNGQKGSLAEAFEIKDYLRYGLVINSPNPFDPLVESTRIMYELQEDTTVKVRIYNLSAEMVWQQVFDAGSEGGKTGFNTITWDGYNAFGEASANGVYLIHIFGGGKTIAKGKIAVLK